MSKPSSIPKAICGIGDLLSWCSTVAERRKKCMRVPRRGRSRSVAAHMPRLRALMAWLTSCVSTPWRSGSRAASFEGGRRSPMIGLRLDLREQRDHLPLREPGRQPVLRVRVAIDSHRDVRRGRREADDRGRQPATAYRHAAICQQFPRSESAMSTGVEPATSGATVWCLRIASTHSE